MKFKPTMKPVLFSGMMLFGITLNAQQTKPVKPDLAAQFGVSTESIKKDLNGTVISNQQFSDSLYTGKYFIKPLVKDQKLIEARLRIATEKEALFLKILIDDSKFKPAPAPDFEVTDMVGKKYKLADLKSKTVVLNFWFKECVPCVKEIPALNELVKANENVVFIAMTEDKKSNVESFLAKKPFHYNIIPNATDIIAKYEISAYPTHCVIKNGILTHKFSKDDAVKELQNAIDGR